MNPPRNVLLTRFSALGDVAMTVPVVYGACRANPEVRFVFATRPHMARMFVNAPANLTVEPVDLARWRGPLGLWRLVSSLRRRHGIDTYVDLHDVLRTKAMRLAARLMGLGTVHYDKQRKLRRRLVRGLHGQLPRPVSGQYAAALAAAGLRPGCAFRSLYGNGRAESSAFAAVTVPKGNGETWVAVAPFAAHPGKRLPIRLVSDLVAALAARPGYKVFVMGFGENEAEATDNCISQAGPHSRSIVNMARAKAGLQAELALMSWCDVMVSADSANMHLASLAALPVVSVWGQTSPLAGFMGHGQSAGMCVQAEMPCRPCSVYGNRPCRLKGAAPGEFACMSRLTADQVTEAVDRALARHACRRPEGVGAD